MNGSNTTSVLPTAQLIQSMLKEIHGLIEGDLLKELLAAESGDVVELARAFVALRQLKDGVDTTAKAFSGIFEEAKTQKLPSAFERSGVPSINLDEGVRITVSQMVRASVKADRKDAAAQWLKDNKLGSVVGETINASTLSAVARTLMEEGQELEPSFFNVVILNNTSVTKTGGTTNG